MPAIRVLSLLYIMLLPFAQRTYTQSFQPFEQDTLVQCGHTPMLLDAGAGFHQYQWHNGSTSRTLEVSASGWQRVMVTDQNGQAMADSVFVVVIPYTLNGYHTDRPAKEWMFSTTADPPLSISSGVIFEGAGQFNYTATSTWTSDTIATIDAVSFFLESYAPADTLYPAGDLLVHRMPDNLLVAAAKWKFPATGGLVTVPVTFETMAHYMYRFTFSKLNEAPALPMATTPTSEPASHPPTTSKPDRRSGCT